MKINFEIVNIPKGKQKKYVTAYLEGELEIYVGNNLYFNQEGILLIEFAIFIARWLSLLEYDTTADFVYHSMDNDEPILSFKLIEFDYYQIYSPWENMEISEYILKSNIYSEFKKYLSELDRDLKLKTGIKLNDLLIT